MSLHDDLYDLLGVLRTRALQAGEAQKPRRPDIVYWAGVAGAYEACAVRLEMTIRRYEQAEIDAMVAYARVWLTMTGDEAYARQEMVHRYARIGTLVRKRYAAEGL